MKQSVITISLLLLVTLSLCCVPAYSQTGSVKGVCKDESGNPITGATVEWMSTDTGRKYTLKTNNKGEYFSLGISPGTYKVTLSKDGKEIYHFGGVKVGVDEADQDFDMKKERAAVAQGQGLSPDQAKAMQEQQAKALKEQSTIKALNEKLNAAGQQAKAGDYDAAIATLNEANQIDPSRDLIWYNLGDDYRMSALKQTDPAEKQKRIEMAVADYQKAIDLRKGSDTAQKDPEANLKLAAYYNNLADALHRANKNDDAIKAYQQALELDSNPAHAAGYWFNIGAVETNSGKVDDAIVAFDKVIAADPNKADAYYWKGVNLIGKATMDKENKMVAPPGTAEAFQKYLELQPSGTFADPAKQMLASIGASIETTYGTKKKPAKK